MQSVVDNAALKVSKMGKKGDMKPKTHHFFYVLVWLAGWLAPPLAVAIRFGIGRDFFINVFCTICGYFPGHFHNFYCQTIRNNSNAARTPKWAVKYGLVKVKDKRGGKHVWAGRYDERLPDSSRHGYGDDNSSIRSSAAEWDGRGPEPAKSERRNGGGSGKMDRGSFWQPWDAEVEPEEVEGAPRAAPAASSSSGGAAAGGDPFENEEFYSSNNDQTGGNYGARAPTGKKSKKGIKGLMGNRDRYESGPKDGATGDRFSKMRDARGGQGGGNDYQDDFERELNEAKRASLAESGTKNGHQPAQKYDQFETEVPEEPTRSAGGAARRPMDEEEQVGGTRQGTRADDDLFNHTF